MDEAGNVVKRKVCKDKCNIDGADGKAAAQTERAKASRKLTIAVVICLIFMAAEIAGGIIANSLAILTDAAHLLSDIAGFAISLFAIWASGWEANPRRTFGYYRLEILGALLSIQIIWLVTGVLVYEAIVRFIRPDKNIDGRIMFGVACSGLLANIIMMFTLGHEGHSHIHEHGHGHGHSQEKRGGHEGEGQGHAPLAPKITFCNRVAKFYRCHGEETHHSHSHKRDHTGVVDTHVKHKHEDEVHVIQGHDLEVHETKPHEHDNEVHMIEPHEKELKILPGQGHNEQDVHSQEDDVPGHVHEEQENKDQEIQKEEEEFHRPPGNVKKRSVKVDQDLCKKTEKKNLNVQGAYLHALGDFIQSIGVTIAGAIIWCKPNLYVVDPICTLIFSVLVLGTTYNMVREIISVLMESTPREVDASALEKGLLGLSGVIAVHELHIWALTVGRCLLACHILAEEQADTDEVLQKVSEYCERVYNISHVTIQVERDV